MTARGEDAAAQAEATSAFSPSASATAPAELPLSTDAPTANLAFPSVAGSCRGRDMCRPAFSASAAAPVVASQTVDSQCCHTRVGRGYAKETEGDGVKERARGRERGGQRQGEKERVEVEGETSRGKKGAGGRRGNACMHACIYFKGRHMYTVCTRSMRSMRNKGKQQKQDTDRQHTHAAVRAHNGCSSAK